MNVARNLRFVTTAMGMVAIAPLLSSPRLTAQQPVAAAQPAVARLVAEPARITIRAGESQPYKVTAYDAQGKEIPQLFAGHQFQVALGWRMNFSVSATVAAAAAWLSKAARRSRQSLASLGGGM